MTDHASIDPAALDRLKEWGGDKLVGQMVRLFLENSGTRMDQIRGGASSGDLNEMEGLALGGDLEGLRALVPRLDEAYASARAELEAIEQGTPE